jgi:hypothetical protein
MFYKLAHMKESEVPVGIQTHNSERQVVGCQRPLSHGNPKKILRENGFSEKYWVNKTTVMKFSHFATICSTLIIIKEIPC